MKLPPDHTRETLVELPALGLARWLAGVRRLAGPLAPVPRWHLPDRPTGDAVAHVRVANLPLPVRLALETEGADGDTMTLFESVAPDIWLATGASATGMTAPAIGTYRLVRADGRIEVYPLPEGPGASESVRLGAVGPMGGLRPPMVSLAVRPKLMRHSRVDAPGLWVLRGDAVPGFTRIVREMDETQMLLWQFALGSHEGRVRVVLRPSHHRRGLAMFLPDVPAYVAHPPVGRVFLPAGMSLLPVPRPDALRSWLRTRPERIYWLDPHPDGIAVESIPESAFRPLRDWVVWKSLAPIRARVGWVDASASLNFEPFRAVLPAPESPPIAPPVAAVVPQPLPTSPSRARTRGGLTKWLLLPLLPLIVVVRALRKFRAPTAEEPPAIDMAVAVRTAIAPLADRLEPPMATRTATQTDLRELENTLIRKLDTLTPTELGGIWAELAAGYHRAGNHADSAICSLLALWDHRTIADELAWGWFRSEATQAAWNPQHVDLVRRLAMPATPAMIRALAAYLVFRLGTGDASTELRENLPTIQTLLEDHEEHLTIRAVWLVRGALSRTSGGDVLALARTRDRLMDRLRTQGLRPDRDLPACLGAGSSNIDRYRHVRTWLGEHRELIQQWIARQARPGSAVALSQMGLEAETKFTSAYADLTLCWGLTRLSDYPAADRLRADALRTLSVDDPVHSLLRDMWLFRIERAREQSPDGAFPESILQRFAKLPQTLRYSVEKMLEHSRILEPGENRNAYRPIVARHGRSELERGLYALSEERDADRVQAGVRELLSQASTEQMATAIPLLLELGGRLGGVFRERVFPRAVALLDDLATPAAVRRVVLERGMLAAAACDEPDLVRALADWLTRHLASRPGGSLAAYEMLSERLLRCLRRVGLRAEMTAIVGEAAKAVLRGYGPSRLAEFHPNETALALRLLIPIAGGWHSCGAGDKAGPLLDHVRTQWQQSTASPPEKTRLAIAYAAVLGQVPAAAALVRLEELFATLGRIQSTGSTNRYYTLRVLELVETVVLSVVSDEFSLGPMVRGWLDDEEFRIRQRIRDDLNAMLQEQGSV